VLAAEGDACRARAGVSLGFPSDVHRFLLLIILRKIPPTALALFLRPGSKLMVSRGPKDVFMKI